MTTETSNYPPEEPLDEQPEEQQEEQEQQKKISPLWIVVIVCAVLACVLLCVIAYLNWPRTEPTPPTVEDGSWQRVLDAGELRVATSADYPPFSFYNDAYQIDGFDVALMKDIGAKLGVPAKISDYAFEGLASVLQIGQADVVIAALAVTPDREALVDFSNIYYVSEDGVLARTDADIGEITNPGQMAGMRIGVQKFSIYQKWVQNNLVNTGLIAEGDLFVSSTG